MLHLEFESVAELDRHLASGGDLSGAVFQGLDLTRHAAQLGRATLSETVFLGCRLPRVVLPHILSCGALVFPRIETVPFDPYRGVLYSADELMGGYQPGQSGSYERTLDGRIYRHYLTTGGAATPSILETLARRLHDHAVSDALKELIAGCRVVAIMGGHSMRRDSADYLSVARISRTLTRRGYLMASGGGPGAMEATHLGAWFSSRPDADLSAALVRLGRAPLYEPKEPWLDTALEVKRAYPAAASGGECGRSLGIPTWLYGHEPPTMFATHIAKYFANSVREEGLLAIANNGVVFAPGSAGTIQEVFQDATQNHYGTFAGPSPMIFLGEEYWRFRKPVFPLLESLAAGHEYSSHLSITDSVAEVVGVIEEFASS